MKKKKVYRGWIDPRFAFPTDGLPKWARTFVRTVAWYDPDSRPTLNHYPGKITVEWTEPKGKKK